MITQSEIKDALDYDPTTGVFTRIKITSNSVSIGDIAGCLRDGYIRIKLHATAYSAHRLAWCYVYGEFPRGEIDHINGKRSDNRIENLRDVSAKTNSKNRKTRKDNGTGFLGVTQKEGKGKYRARIHVGGKELYLGCFEKISDAVKARVDADETHGFHPNHGTR